MLDQKIKDYIDRSVLCWLATANHLGEPNVSPKEMFTYFEDRYLLIADIASPKSVHNLRENQSVCVSFVDIFVQKGYKLIGKARLIEKEDLDFKKRVGLLRKLGGDGFPIHRIIEIEVTGTCEIVAPSYFISPETTEADQIKQSMQSYGVEKLSTFTK